MNEKDRRDNKALAVEIVAAIRDEMGVSCPVPADVCRANNEFVTQWIEERRAKRERMEKIKTHVAGWAVVSVLGGIGTLGYKTIQYLQDHLK